MRNLFFRMISKCILTFGLFLGWEKARWETSNLKKRTFLSYTCLFFTQLNRHIVKSDGFHKIEGGIFFRALLIIFLTGKNLKEVFGIKVEVAGRF